MLHPKADQDEIVEGPGAQRGQYHHQSEARSGAQGLLGLLEGLGVGADAHGGDQQQGFRQQGGQRHPGQL